MKGVNSPYGDIIDLPHHTSKTHPRMPVQERAAQFSPFAALTGYEDAVAEAGRLTAARIELEEDRLEQLDRRLALLAHRAGERPEISIVRFARDKKKPGGAYVTLSGRYKRTDEYTRSVILTDGTAVPIDDILSLDSPLFDGAEPYV